MTKILFLYNDLNSVAGISTVMGVVERYARNSKQGNFKVTTRPHPAINFENGASIAVRPVTQGLSNLAEFDKIFVDKSIDVMVDSSRFSNNVELYDINSFSDNVNGGN